MLILKLIVYDAINKQIEVISEIELFSSEDKFINRNFTLTYKDVTNIEGLDL